MRKLFVALLVGAVAVGLAAPAFAADLKFTGSYRVRFQFDDASPCIAADTTGVDCSGHQFQTRFRPRFDVETEGGVRGVLRLEIGDVRFGNAGTGNVGGGTGGGHGADGVNVETKWAYIDFPVPATPLRLRAGIQPFFLSKALFFDDDASGISLYGKLGEVNVNAWWTRLNRGGAAGGAFENQGAGVIAASGSLFTPLFPNEGINAGSDGQAARDLYGLDLSFSPYKDLNFNLYFVYDHDNEQQAAGLLTDPSTGFWIGGAVAGKIQNIRYDFDIVYGSKETIHPAAANPSPSVDQKGFVIDGGVGMAIPGTALDLELRGWFATGWDGSLTGDIDAFPVLYAGSGGHEPGTQVWGGGGVIDIDALADNPQNTWGVGLIARYAVNPNLKLTANVHYIGTQEEGIAASPSPVGDGFLFGVDSVGTEIGLRVDYTIHRGLVFTLTAGHLFLGDDTVVGTTTARFDDITKVAGLLQYDF